MINQRERNEKIIRMKLQTAKVLWQEGRKDASFFVIESIDDPRGDALRERMGFTDDYEVGGSDRSSMPIRRLSMIAIAVISFIIGFVVSPDSGAGTVANLSQGDDQRIETIVAPTLESGKSLSQPQIDLTSISAQGQPTRNAVQTQQSDLKSWIQLSETAQYRHATATENARGTQSVGGD